MAETGQPYAYTGDDPVNGVDPLGLIGQGNTQLAKQVEAEDAAGDVGSNKPIIDIAGGLAHFVATHKTDIIIGAGIALGAVSFGTGALAAGALLGADVGVSAGVLGTTSVLTGLGAVAIDAPTCLSKSANSSAKVGACTAAASGAIGAALGGLTLLLPEAVLSGYVASYGAGFAGAADILDILHAFGVFNSRAGASEVRVKC